MRKRDACVCFALAVLLGLTGAVASGRQPAFERRILTDGEFSRLRALSGTYEEGRNYNVIIHGHGTGLRPPTEEQWRSIRSAPILLIAGEPFRDKTAPPSHDNSVLPWFPPIGTQDGEGSCVSWACAYYTKTFQEAKEHNWDLSGCVWEGGYYGNPSAAYQDMIASPDFVYHQVNDGGDNGSTYSDNMNLMERIGSCSWTQMPYDPTNSTTWPDEDAWREAPLYRSATGYGLMWVDTDSVLEVVKEWISDTCLAIISIHAGYYDYLTDEDLWTLDNYTPSGTNHANTIVGYDDNYGPYTEDGDPNTYGAFKVANSWLTGGWENVPDGFYYISYECLKQRIEYVMFYENLVDYEPEMIAVFELTHGARGECLTTAGVWPDHLKRFDDYGLKGGNHPFPANAMVMDMTEFLPLISPPGNLFFEVYDGGDVSSGSIDQFSIEIYDDYSSGVPVETYTSPQTPVSTVDYEPVRVFMSPVIQFASYVPSDSGGDDDGSADPGESVELVVTVENLGLDASGVSAELTSDDPYVQVDVSEASYGDVVSGGQQTSATPYRFAVDPSCPDPHIAVLDLEITGDGSYAALDSFYLAIGSATGFEDDMESGEGGWRHRAISPGYVDQWHMSTQRSHGGTTSWKCGDTGGGPYSDLADGGLMTPPFLLAPGCTLRFWHWMDAEVESGTTAWDGAIVMLSLDNGEWLQIEPVGGYPYTIVPNPASPFEPGTPCLSGTHDWQELEFDLGGYEGLAQVMFRFGSDGWVTEEGWYIDDVEIVGTVFLRADANADLNVGMSDAIFTLRYLYVPGADIPSCMDAADADDGGSIEMADGIYILRYLYVPGSPAPSDPGPNNCGVDPSGDGLDCVGHPCMSGGE